MSAAPLTEDHANSLLESAAPQSKVYVIFFLVSAASLAEGQVNFLIESATPLPKVYVFFFLLVSAAPLAKRTS